MDWIYIALIPPFLWAITNCIDKFLLINWDCEDSEGAFFIISLIGALPTALLFLIFTEANFQEVEPLTAMLLIFQGFFTASYVLPYFIALKNDEPSRVVALFAFCPLLTFVIEYLFLKTTVSFVQILGSLLIVFSSVTLSLDYKLSGFRFNFKTLLLILLSSIIFILGEILFKYIGVSSEVSFWTLIMYSYIGTGSLALVTLLLWRKYRVAFFKTVKSFKKREFALVSINEILGSAAYIVLFYCFTVYNISVALVDTVAMIQPFFILIFSVFIVYFFPNQEAIRYSKWGFLNRLASFAVIVMGVYLLH